jgi:hypothetical protein
MSRKLFCQECLAALELCQILGFLWPVSERGDCDQLCLPLAASLRARDILSELTDVLLEVASTELKAVPRSNDGYCKSRNSNVQLARFSELSGSCFTLCRNLAASRPSITL